MCKWISVKDRLPEDGQRVLFGNTKTRECRMLYYEAKEELCWENPRYPYGENKGTDIKMFDVWISVPLPAPPDGGDDE